MRPPPSIVLDPSTLKSVKAPDQEARDGTNKVTDTFQTGTPASCEATNVFQIGTPTSREAHFIGTPKGKKQVLVQQDTVGKLNDGGDDASVTVNEQEWPSDLVIQSHAQQGPVVRELLSSAQFCEETECAAYTQESSTDTLRNAQDNGCDMTATQPFEVCKETVPRTLEDDKKTANSNAQQKDCPDAHEHLPTVVHQEASVAAVKHPEQLHASSEAVASRVWVSKDFYREHVEHPDNSIKEAYDDVHPKASTTVAEQCEPSNTYTKAPPPQSFHLKGCTGTIAPKEHSAASTTVNPESKSAAPERTLSDKRFQKYKVIEDGFHLAGSLEGQNKLKEAEAQYRRTLAICTTLLGERPPTAHKSMRELRSRTSAALERVRTK